MKLHGASIKKILVFTIALVIALMGCKRGMWTASADSSGATGSIRFNLSNQMLSSLPAGSVIRFNVYRVGRANNSGFEVYSAYSTCGILEATTSSEKAEAARKAAQIAEQSGTPTTIMLNNGQYSMTNVEYGIYLVTLAEAPDGFVCTPSLVTMPCRTQDGAYKTDITITFKASYAQPTEQPTASPTPTPSVTPSPTPSVTPAVTPEVTPPQVTPTPTPRVTPTAVPTTSVTVTKTWVDNQNEHGIRPSTVTVALYADGQYVNVATMNGSSSEDSWTYTFEGVPAVNSNGEPVTFTVRETVVQGYTSMAEGVNIVNTLIPKMPEQYGTISGRKTWVGDSESTRPKSITVRLYRNGDEIAQCSVGQITNWEYSFENMPLDDGYGNAYTYTVAEDSISGYIPRVNGYNITNTALMPPVIDPTNTTPTPPMPTTPPAPTTPPGPTTITLTVIVETSDGDKLPDVQVTVSNNDGGDTVSDATDDNGVVEFEVEPGEYTVTAETPAGYLSNDPEVITVTDDHTLTIVYNRGSELPSTGSVWLIPMYGIGVAIILLSVFFHKKKVYQK